MRSVFLLTIFMAAFPCRADEDGEFMPNPDRDLASTHGAADTTNRPNHPDLGGSLLNTDPDWEKFKKFVKARERRDYVDGLSFIISGGLAIVGGQVGQAAATDPIEQGVYALFQSIGIASVGYGIYTWRIGGDERMMHDTLEATRGLDDRSRAAVLRAYFETKRDLEKREKFVKAITHGMIAAYNIYSASQQTNGPIKNALFFIGGVNVLACLTYSF